MANRTWRCSNVPVKSAAGYRQVAWMRSAAAHGSSPSHCRAPSRANDQQIVSAGAGPLVRFDGDRMVTTATANQEARSRDFGAFCARLEILWCLAPSGALNGSKNRDGVANIYISV